MTTAAITDHARPLVLQRDGACLREVVARRHASRRNPARMTPRSTLRTLTNRSRHHAQRWVRKVGRSITNSETPHGGTIATTSSSRSAAGSSRTARASTASRIVSGTAPLSAAANTSVTKNGLPSCADEAPSHRRRDQPPTPTPRPAIATPNATARPMVRLGAHRQATAAGPPARARRRDGSPAPQAPRGREDQFLWHPRRACDYAILADTTARRKR